MHTISQIDNLKDKKVLLRVDFDVPVDINGHITESFRIEKQKETINCLIDREAKVFMVAHSNYIPSFQPIIKQLKVLLNHHVKFIPELKAATQIELDENLGLLENIRIHEGEKKNDENLGRLLSTGFDYYINNAFAESHRNYVSVSAVTKFIPSYAGLLIEKETSQLQKAIDAPKGGKIIIIGGAKAETKVPVIKNLIDKSDKVIVGGIVANDILKERGRDIGDSVADENSKELLAGLNLNDSHLVVPEDFNIFENKIFDIGPKSIARYEEFIKSAKMIIWNGPMGLFEDFRFSAGTDAIGRAVANARGNKVIGGGDTVAAVSRLGILDKFDPSVNSGQSFVSTGGGAMLEFLAGNKLPGLEALGYYESR